jgi:hypothetical protein
LFLPRDDEAKHDKKKSSDDIAWEVVVENKD